jgi:hypothetical protein
VLFIAFKYFSKYSARQRSPENKKIYKTLTRQICSNFQIAFVIQKHKWFFCFQSRDMFFNLCNLRVQCAGSPTNNMKYFIVFIVHVKCSSTGLYLPSFIQHSWIKLGFLLTNHIPRIKGHSSRKISSIRLTKLIDWFIVVLRQLSNIPAISWLKVMSVFIWC